jgi:hypothetical protein
MPDVGVVHTEVGDLFTHGGFVRILAYVALATILPGTAKLHAAPAPISSAAPQECLIKNTEAPGKCLIDGPGA